VLFCRDKRGRGPVPVDRNARQPWPDQTGCFFWPLSGGAAGASEEEKVKESGMSAGNSCKPVPTAFDPVSFFGGTFV